VERFRCCFLTMAEGASHGTDAMRMGAHLASFIGVCCPVSKYKCDDGSARLVSATGTGMVCALQLVAISVCGRRATRPALSAWNIPFLRRGRIKSTIHRFCCWVLPSLEGKCAGVCCFSWSIFGRKELHSLKYARKPKTSNINLMDVRWETLLRLKVSSSRLF